MMKMKMTKIMITKYIQFINEGLLKGKPISELEHKYDFNIGDLVIVEPINKVGLIINRGFNSTLKQLSYSVLLRSMDNNTKEILDDELFEWDGYDDDKDDLGAYVSIAKKNGYKINMPHKDDSYGEYTNEGLLKGKSEDDVLNKIKDLDVIGKWKMLKKNGTRYNLDVDSIFGYDDMSDDDKKLFDILKTVQYVSDPYEGVYSFREHGVWGLIDADLNVRYTDFDNIHDFYDGIAPVTLKGKWGFIDLRGNLVIPIMYDSIEKPSEGCISVEYDGLWGIINSEGYEIVEIKYQLISTYHDGLCAIGNDNKIGFVDTKGDIIIPLIYSDAHDFSDGLAVVITQDGREVTINKEGKVVKEGKTRSY